MAKMSNTKKIIKQEVSSFLKEIHWKKVLTFLFFVMLASIFWIMQIYRQKFEATQIIPINYVNIPDRILLVNDMPTHIKARYKDDGITLFKYFFTKDKDSLVINVKKIINNNPQPYIIQSGVLEQMIRSKLFATSDLLSYYPSYISFQYAPLNKKQLAVIYDGYINLNPGYMKDGELKITPDFVKAYGRKEALDTLLYAHTYADTITNLTGDKTISVKIKPINGIKFVPNTVQISIPVDEYTEKEVEVPVKCINLPANMTARFFPPKVKIPMYVGLKRYKDISSANFQVVVDYNEIKEKTESTIALRILSSPDFVKTKSPVPSEVEFIIENNTEK